jgi:hypothetical protein
MNPAANRSSLRQSPIANRPTHSARVIPKPDGVSRLERIIERVRSICASRDDADDLTDPRRWLQAEREIDAALETSDV